MKKVLLSLAIILAFCSCNSVDTEAISNSIKISKCILCSPSFLGGCDFEYEVKNVSDQIVKYITISGEVYDAVGEKVECSSTGESAFTFTNRGPFEIDVEYTCRKNGLVFNPNAVKVEITSVNVVYMDDTILEIPEKYIDLILQ